MNILDLVAASNRAWRSVTNVTWEHYIPNARAQPDALPRGGRSRKRSLWAGCCCVQAFSETLTGRLRIWHKESSHMFPPALQYEENGFEVDLIGMIHCTAAHGVLTEVGSSVYHIGRLGQQGGVPMKGKVPYEDLRTRKEKLKDPILYAMGTSIKHYPAVPLPCGTPTLDQFEEAMEYREHLCACLDTGPVVVFLRAQPHYLQVGRPADQPYRRREYTLSEMVHTGLGLEQVQGVGHCVTVFGYHCPTGDVSSLLLDYQENALTLKEPQPGEELKKEPEIDTVKGLAKRHVMDPDAIEHYYVPNLNNVHFTPRRHITTISQAKPRATSLWDDIKRIMTS